MTAISYPDVETTSPSGRFTLEARSPHNGTIPRQNGTLPTADDYAFQHRDRQREFRYRLRDNPGNRILWERWQDDREDSPHQLLVADTGWSIVRTHGFQPGVMAFAPEGREAIRVKIVSDGPPNDRFPDTRPGIAWHARNLRISTAGALWTWRSWPYFLDHANRPFFCWRTARGQRLVLNLSESRVLTDAEGADPDLARDLDAAEQTQARDLLATLTARLDEARALLDFGSAAARQYPFFTQVQQIWEAVLLVGTHRLRDCLPDLRAWEDLDRPGSTTGSSAIRNGSRET